jgi:hypothetical protein
VRHSTLIRAELEDAVAGMTPAARAVFEDIQRTDEDAEPELPEGFEALTPPRGPASSRRQNSWKSLPRRKQRRTLKIKNSLKAFPG